jgi:ribonuclease D
LDRSTFRVVGNETLLQLARTQPRTLADLSKIRGISRSILERNNKDILDAIRRGCSIPDAELPKFPRAPRWTRDPDFDDNVARLKAARDMVAAELQLDPGVLCARDRLEAVARKKPASVDELKEIPELRNWQIEVLGKVLINALAGKPVRT